MNAERTAAAARDAGARSEAGKALRWRLGRWLKLQRESAGLTQADLAEKLGLRYYSFISQVEGGYGRIPQALYIAWADSLGVDRKTFGWMVLQHMEPGLYQLLTGRTPPDPADDLSNESLSTDPPTQDPVPDVPSRGEGR